MHVVNLMLFHGETGARVDMQEVFRVDELSVYISSRQRANSCTCISKAPRGPIHSACWFTPSLLCSSTGRLWLAFPSWAHLKFRGLVTDNKGAVALRPSAAKCLPRVLQSLCRSACCPHWSWRLKVTQVCPEELQSHLWIMVMLPFSLLLFALASVFWWNCAGQRWCGGHKIAEEY